LQEQTRAKSSNSKKKILIQRK